MSLHNLLLSSFSFAIVVLLIIKWKISHENKVKKTSKIDMAGAMTIGTREVQEDCFYMKESDNGTLLALADGMGEPYGGRIASRTAIKTIADIFDSYNTLDNPSYFFKKSFNSANSEILKELSNGVYGNSSLGTAIIYQNKLFYAVVGNVKIAIFRKGDLVEITTGHTIGSLAKKEFITGKITRDEAMKLLENQRLYNYLGQDGFSDLEIFDTPITLIKDDIIILMTDGIYDLLNFNELEESLKKQISCEKIAYEIIEKVNKNEKTDKDNASIMLLKIRSD